MIDLEAFNYVLVKEHFQLVLITIHYDDGLCYSHLFGQMLFSGQYGYINLYLFHLSLKSHDQRESCRNQRGFCCCKSQ